MVSFFLKIRLYNRRSPAPLNSGSLAHISLSTARLSRASLSLTAPLSQLSETLSLTHSHFSITQLGNARKFFLCVQLAPQGQFHSDFELNWIGNKLQRLRFVSDFTCVMYVYMNNVNLYRDSKLRSVSYTHLTLPTTPYV